MCGVSRCGGRGADGPMFRSYWRPRMQWVILCATVTIFPMSSCMNSSGGEMTDVPTPPCTFMYLRGNRWTPGWLAEVKTCDTLPKRMTLYT